MRDITGDEFVKLVRDKIITHDEKISMSASELLELIKDKLEFEKIAEDVQAERDELETTNLRLQHMLKEEKATSGLLSKKVLNVMEHEKIQRQRAIKLQEQLSNSYMTEGMYSVRYDMRG